MPLFFCIFGMLVMILAAGKSGLRGLRILRSHLFCLAGQVKSCNLVFCGTGSRRRRRDGLVSALAPYITLVPRNRSGGHGDRPQRCVGGRMAAHQAAHVARRVYVVPVLAYKISVSWHPGTCHNGFSRCCTTTVCRAFRMV